MAKKKTRLNGFKLILNLPFISHNMKTKIKKRGFISARFSLVECSPKAENNRLGFYISHTLQMA